jgi:hypothetical protein
MIDFKSLIAGKDTRDAARDRRDLRHDSKGR